MTRIIVLLMAVSVAGAVRAAPNDFAYGRVLQPTETSTVQRVQVPQDVYERVVRADLGDLRVYNAGHDEMPYALRRPASTEAHSGWTELPVFGLPELTGSGEAGAKVNIELGDQGTVVAVHGATTEGAPSAGYLVDASGFEQQLDELSISWAPTGGGFIGKFQVETSDDLDSWRTAVASATLATLETGGRRIVADRLELPGVRSRYLRIRQLDGASLDIHGVSFRTHLKELPDRHWKTLNGTFVDDGYEYDSGGQFPMDRVAIELPAPTFLVTAHLYSRDRSDRPWRDRGERTFYRVEVDGLQVTSDPIAYSVRDRYWRVEMSNADSGTPMLTIGWLPDELIFLKQGRPPYVLVYGRSETTGRQWPMSDLLRGLDNEAELHTLPSAGISAAEVLGGPARLEPAPEPVDWETVLLWSILILGVGCVGLLAARLLRQSA